jgi:hypothetical protein
VLGLSLRGTSAILRAIPVELTHSSTWWDVQALATRLKRRLPRQVRVLGLDWAYVQGMGKKQGVLVAIGFVDEHHLQAVNKWLAPLVQRLEVSVIDTDDLQSYRIAAAKLGLEQQVCQFHLRR